MNKLKTLTGKQEAFAQSIVDGKNQSDAYRLNYACERMTPKQIWEEASKLAANPKVSQRIASLRQAVADSVVAKKAWNTERFIDEAEEICTWLGVTVNGLLPTQP